MRRIRHSQKGQALPLVMLFLLVLMGILALVLDGGNGFAQRRRMQNAADAAAVSCALTIIKGEYRATRVQEVATQYGQANGAATIQVAYLDKGGSVLPTPPNGMVPIGADSVRVTTARPFPTFFARLLGFQTMTASAVAKASAVAAAMPSYWVGLSPLSVPINFYEACAHITDSCDVWDAQYAAAWGLSAAEYKSLVDLSMGAAGGAKSQLLAQWTQYGYDGMVFAGSWLPAYTGNTGSNIAESLRLRILAHPEGVDPDGVIWGTVDMTIWNAYQDRNIRVLKFGRFKVRMTDIYGSHAFGHFVDFVVPGHLRGDPSPEPGPVIIVLGG